MYLLEERRRYKRVSIVLPVLCCTRQPKDPIYCSEKETFSATTVDLSEGGAALITGQYLPLSTLINIRFKKDDDLFSAHSDLDRYIIFSGKVTHSIPLRNRRFRIGVDFGPVTEELRTKFYDAICIPSHSNQEDNTYI